MAGNKPCLTLSGPNGVQLSIWKNRRDGKEWFSCKASRRFRREGADQWESTDSFGARDLLSLALLCNRAAEIIGIKQFGPGLTAAAAEYDAQGETKETTVTIGTSDDDNIPF